jgi:hypothetical protein
MEEEMNVNNFADFLDLPEADRFNFFNRIKLHWWQRIQIKFINKWWTAMRNSNPGIQAITLWESIYKGRF